MQSYHPGVLSGYDHLSPMTVMEVDLTTQQVSLHWTGLRIKRGLSGGGQTKASQSWITGTLKFEPAKFVAGKRCQALAGDAA